MAFSGPFLDPTLKPQTTSPVFESSALFKTKIPNCVERSKESPRYSGLKSCLPSARAKGKVFLFLSETSPAMKAKHEGECPETSLPFVFFCVLVFVLLLLWFSVRLFKKYQTGAENGNTIFFHHNCMLRQADGPTLCKDPLILYAFTSNCLHSLWPHWLLCGKQTVTDF